MFVKGKQLKETEFDQKSNLTTFQTLKTIFLFLDFRERFLSVAIAFGNIISSFVDTIAIISVMPIVTMIVDGSLENSHPKILSLYKFLDNPNFYDFVFYITCISILLLFFSVSFAIFMQWIATIFRIRCQNRLAKVLSYSLLNAPYKWHLSKSSSKNAHHLFNDVLVWSSGGINSILSFFSNVSLLTFICVIIVISMGSEGFFGLLFLGLIALFLVKSINPLIQRKSADQRKYHANSYSIISEILYAIKDIKLSNKISYFVLQYIEQFSSYGRSMGWLKILQSLPSFTFLFFVQCTILLSALFMFKIGLSGAEIATNIALIILIVARGIPAINKVVNDYGSLSNALPSLKSLVFLTSELNIVTATVPDKEVSSSANWQKLKFDNVCFKYEKQTENLLTNINLEFKKGKTYCIVGSTGSGKTTFLDIFLGLLHPIKGKILLDEKELNSNNLINWQKNIAYVPQNTVVFNKNAYENIALGSYQKDMDIKKINNLLENLELFKDLFDKYGDNSLGEFGKNISGGQRQRLSIARALYKNCPILVLDEITSALDFETEKKIIQVIKKLKGNITIVCVTHKQQFLEIADIVLKVNNGKITKLS